MALGLHRIQPEKIAWLYWRQCALAQQIRFPCTQFRVFGQLPAPRTSLTTGLAQNKPHSLTTFSGKNKGTSECGMRNTECGR